MPLFIAQMKEQRIRITFAKITAMRYTGHLDLRRAWERTFRRAGLPLAYSQGYTPRPQFNFAAPLPLGFLSTYELADFWLEEHRRLEIIHHKLAQAAPPGITLREVLDIPHLHRDKLPTLVQAADYEVRLSPNLQDIEDQIDRLRTADEIIRQRRDNKYDMTALLFTLKRLPDTPKGQQRLWMKLSLLPGATGRPDEVIDEMGGNSQSCRITRTMIHLKRSSQD